MKTKKDVMDIIFENLENSQLVVAETMNYELSDLDSKPNHASYYSVDVSLSDYVATDAWGDFTYSDLKEMRERILKLVDIMWTDELLELFRKKSIDNLTFRIGPKTLSNVNLEE